MSQNSHHIRVNDESGHLLILSALLCEVEHVSLVGVDGVLLAQVQRALEDSIPPVLVVDVNRRGDEITKLCTCGRCG